MYGKTQINTQSRKGRKNNAVRKLKWKRDRKDGGAARSFTKLSEMF